MEAADSTQAKDAYIAAMGCDGAMEARQKTRMSMLSTLPPSSRRSMLALSARRA